MVGCVFCWFFFVGLGGDFLALGVTVPLGTFRKAISTTYRNCISVGSEP